MENFLKKLICNHKNAKERREKRHFDAWADMSFAQNTTLVDSFIAVYAIFDCPDCGKTFITKLLQKQFTGWQRNLDYQEYLKENDCITYDEYVLGLK